MSKEEYLKAENYAAEHHVLPTDFLLSEGIINDHLLGQANAELLGFPYVDINTRPPSLEQMSIIPETIAKQYRIVVVKADKVGVTIASDKPNQPGLDEVFKKYIPGKKIKVGYAQSQDVDTCFLVFRKPLTTRFAEILSSKKDSISEIFLELFNDAVTFKTSDVHFDARKNETVVRFRIDGIVHEVGKMPRATYDTLLNYIKVQANLRIDEHYSPQDGAIRLAQRNNTVIDLRVSIVPTVGGEKVTIRILSQYIKNLGLSDLGLSNKHQERITTSINKPFGMIMVVGPTGSGKTTTLYSLLRQLSTPDVTVATIEDPVEYVLEEASQIQVNQKTGLTFAKGLRSIVRHDPDIILVGEIRDEETAEISVNSALTGHLLLTTFHANNAATAIPRLIEIGVEPFLLSSTLELIIAQRLVRKICSACRYSYTVDRKSLGQQIEKPERFFSETKIRLYKGKGCEACKNIGYRGRVALFEIIQVTSELANLFLQNPTADSIWKVAEKQGSETLFVDGIAKVKEGSTTLEEVLRVASPNG